MLHNNIIPIVCNAHRKDERGIISSFPRYTRRLDKNCTRIKNLDCSFMIVKWALNF